MAPTQDALYRELDLDLSWSESDLPERERTKHVHRLHPYLGKFVPQLVEAMLERHLPGAKTILDPFAGSGTTLVQSLESGRDATGVDVAAFNCLLMRVKTAEYNLFSLEHELRDSLRRLDAFDGARPARPNRYLDAWYAPKAAAQLVFYRSLVDDYEHADVMRVVLTRAARSARRTTAGRSSRASSTAPSTASPPTTHPTHGTRRTFPSSRRPSASLHFARAARRAAARAKRFSSTKPARSPSSSMSTAPRQASCSSAAAARSASWWARRARSAPCCRRRPAWRARARTTRAR